MFVLDIETVKNSQVVMDLEPFNLERRISPFCVSSEKPYHGSLR